MVPERCCETCRFWNRSIVRSDPTDDTIELHPCHARSPGFDDRTGVAVWPATAEDDWCGDHKRREAE